MSSIFRRSSSAKVAGFTLLELIVVLALMSFLTTSVALSFRTPLQKARLDAALSSIQSMDRRLRYTAIHKNRSEVLLLDLGLSELRIVGSAQVAVRLPKGISISKVYVSRWAEESDRLSISYFPDGSSHSWSLQVSDTGSHFSRWLLVSGKTGQVSMIENEEEVADVFQLLAKGYDAN